MSSIVSIVRRSERLSSAVGILLICLTNAALGLGVVRVSSMSASVPDLALAFGPAFILIMVSCLYWMYTTQRSGQGLFSLKMLRFSPGALVLILSLAPLMALFSLMTAQHLGLTHSIIALMVVVGAVGVVVAAVRNVNWAFCVFLLVLPLALALHVAFRSEQLVGDGMGYIALNPETLLLLLTGAAVTLGLLARKEGLVRTKLDVPIAVFLVASIVSVFFSANPVHSSRMVFALVMAILCYYLVVNTVRTRNGLLLSIAVLLCSFLVIGAYGLLAFGRETSEPGLLQGATRADPTFTNPTLFASVLVLILPLSICLAVSPVTTPEVKVGAVVMAGLLFVSLVFTYTRGAWVAFGVSALVLLFYRTGIRSISVKALPLLAVVFLAARDFWIDLFLARTYSRDYFVQSAPWLGRLASWEASINMISANPLTGIGPGMFMSAFREYEIGRFSMTMSDAHNLFLHAGAESGIIAAVALLAVFGIALWLSYRVFHRSEDSLLRDVGLGLFAGLIGFLVYTVTTGDILVKYSLHNGVYYFFTGHTLYLFIFLGLIVALYRLAIPKGIEKE
jgi:O-antigen ligase